MSIWIKAKTKIIINLWYFYFLVSYHTNQVIYTLLSEDNNGVYAPRELMSSHISHAPVCFQPIAYSYLINRLDQVRSSLYSLFGEGKLPFYVDIGNTLRITYQFYCCENGALTRLYETLLGSRWGERMHSLHY